MAGRTLTVFLAADTTKFRKGMNDAGDGVDGPTGLKGRVGGLTHSLNNMLGPAMLGAAAGAAVMAGKFAVDGVQAAIAEQAEVEKLATALDNLGFGDATASVEEWISAQARATTFSDSNLRPSMALLAGATKNVTGAQELLTLAMDISIGTGKDLDSVSAALAKAYDGNTGALKRLIPGITDAELKSDDLFESTGALSERFAGQAATAAVTWEGKIGNVSEAFGELQESFGQGFLDGLSAAEGGVDGLTTMMYDNQDTVKEFGKQIGDAATSTLELMDAIVSAKNAMSDWMDDDGAVNAFVREFMASLGMLTGGVNTLASALQDAYRVWMLLQGVTTVKDVTYTGPENPVFK